jgi:hypothetical protein
MYRDYLAVLGVPRVCVCVCVCVEREREREREKERETQLRCFVVNVLATDPILLNRSAGIRLISLVFATMYLI